MSHYSPNPAEAHADQLRRDRATVRATAERGSSPAAAYPAEDLEALFSAEELEELEALAVETRAKIAARREHAAQAALLTKTTARVLVELKAEQERELRAKAEMIARERLGLS